MSFPVKADAVAFGEAVDAAIVELQTGGAIRGDVEGPEREGERERGRQRGREGERGRERERGRREIF